ncbi:MAG: helix-turn-helix domain-containing protein [Rhizobacter sp.]|nr:helix-turn-helix domain-containing protein [Rhizobacter sp.]
MAGCAHDLYISNMKAPNPSIRTYSLFGESASLPDVMHCETIAARSALHGWELAPHRHARLHQVLLLQSGGGAANIEGQAVPLLPMSLVNVPPGNVHAFVFEPGTQGWVATLAHELLDQMLASATAERRALARCCVLAADEPVRAVMAQIAHEFESRAPARALVLRGLCAALLGLTARAVALHDPAKEELAGSDLLHRFEMLIEDHFLEHWTVTDYARALAVSATHLSRVARVATGEPASRLIEARVMREARRNLAYTSLPVTTIAYALGFGDPAYFSRAFSRAEGVSPRGFRERLA